jgi:hypothetical protein
MKRIPSHIKILYDPHLENKAISKNAHFHYLKWLKADPLKNKDEKLATKKDILNPWVLDRVGSRQLVDISVNLSVKWVLQSPIWPILSPKSATLSRWLPSQYPSLDLHSRVTNRIPLSLR